MLNYKLALFHKTPIEAIRSKGMIKGHVTKSWINLFL
jgi:hypothetical protein